MLGGLWLVVAAAGACLMSSLTAGPAFRPVHPRARLDSPAAPAIRVQLQAAPRLRDEKVSLVLKRLAARAGLPTPTATPATRPAGASRPSCAATAPATWRSPLPAGSAWTRCAATPRRPPSGTIPRPPGSGCRDDDRDRLRRAPRGDRRPGPGAGPAGSGRRIPQLCLADTIGVGTPSQVLELTLLTAGRW